MPIKPDLETKQRKLVMILGVDILGGWESITPDMLDLQPEKIACSTLLERTRSDSTMQSSNLVTINKHIELPQMLLCLLCLFVMDLNGSII